jgi:Domain of unknown function (DUF4936)
VSSRRVYIYFRVERERVADAAATVRELQAAWQAAMPGLQCELLRRADEEGNFVTLMETYVCADGVSSAWQELIEREAAAALGPWLRGQRHIERFEPCA